VETIKARVKKSSDEKKYSDSLQIEKEQEKLLQSLVKETGVKKEKIKLVISAILSELLVEQKIPDVEKTVEKLKKLLGTNVDLEIVEKIKESLSLKGYIFKYDMTDKGIKLLRRVIC